MSTLTGLLRDLCLSVFKPGAFASQERELARLSRSGWLLIALRWTYYSLVFVFFRDYHGRWAPFVPPPFGLDLDRYALLQQILSLPFGFLLMGAMSLALAVYLRQRGRPAPVLSVLNILGVTFFLPFVIVQPIDQLVVFTIGWKLVPVTVIHTAILIWESWAAAVILSRMYKLSLAKQGTGIIFLTVTWIVLTGVLWR